MLISLIIPAYNAEKFLNKCVDSILELYSNCAAGIEIIIVNDGSKDRTRQICDEYARQKKEWIRVFHTENKGVSEARNLGISKAKGEYIMFVDADDCLLPGAIDVFVNEVNKYHSDYIVFPLVKEVAAGVEKTQRYTFEGQVVSAEEACTAFYKDGNNGPWSKLFRTEIIRNNKLEFDKDLKIHEDVMFCMGFLESCETVRYSDKPVYFYRYNSGGAIGKQKIAYLSNYSVAYFKWLRFLDEHSCPHHIKTLNSEYLRKMLTTCGKLYKNGVSKAEIEIELKSNALYKKLIEMKFEKPLDKLQQFMLGHQMFWLVALKVR